MGIRSIAAVALLFTGTADAVPALIAVYGPAGSTGQSSAVFQQDAVSSESLRVRATQVTAIRRAGPT